MRRRGIVAMALLALALVGCGGDSDGAETGAGTTPSGSTSTPTSTSTTATKPDTGTRTAKSRMSCRPTPVDAPVADITTLPAGERLELRFLKPEGSVTVRAGDVTTSRTAKGSAGRMKARGGRFVVVGLSIDNTGKSALRPATTVLGRMILLAGGDAYARADAGGQCLGVQGMLADAAGVAAPARIIAPGQRGRTVAAFIVPTDAGRLRLFAQGTGKAVRLHR